VIRTACARRPLSALFVLFKLRREKPMRDYRVYALDIIPPRIDLVKKSGLAPLYKQIFRPRAL
jgi:hypothetical protein